MAAQSQARFGGGDKATHLLGCQAAAVAAGAAHKTGYALLLAPAAISAGVGGARFVAVPDVVQGCPLVKRTRNQSCLFR